jgi:hypothetical protein
LCHSEGSWIAPQVPQKSDLVSGMILLSSSVETMNASFLRQTECLDEMVKDPQWKRIKNIPTKLLFKLFNPIKLQAKQN